MGKNEKQPFVFEWLKPCSDWFETKRIEIKTSDYCYFRIERRFGPSWWLIGMNAREEPKYHWEDTQIGEIMNGDLRRFIEWAKSDNGSKIIEIKSICGSFDIIEEILKVLPKATDSTESA